MTIFKEKITIYAEVVCDSENHGSKTTSYTFLFDDFYEIDYEELAYIIEQEATKYVFYPNIDITFYMSISNMVVKNTVNMYCGAIEQRSSVLTEL